MFRRFFYDTINIIRRTFYYGKTKEKYNFCKSATWAFGIISVIFAFVPESFFHTIRWIPAQAVQKSLTDKGITDVELDTIISRIVCYAVVWVIVTLIYAVRHSVTIKGDNYTIKVKYGNLLKETNCKRVINFDECYTTHIGSNPSDIKASSICGQYIQSVGGSLNIQNLIDNAEVKPKESVSRFNNLRSYKPGSIIVNLNHSTETNAIQMIMEKYIE